MAWAALRFSREARERLVVVLRVMLIVQLIISLCMVIFCYNTSMKVLLILKNIHKMSMYLLFVMILLQAYCMKLHYTSGFRLMSWLLHGPYWARAMLASRVWMLIGCAVAANGILVFLACQSTLQALLTELNASLRVGISQYLLEPSWKKLLDKMQIELGCCGADKPGDWHEIPWINMHYLNEHSQVVMRLAGADGRVLPPVSPFSCCTPRVLAPCYHDPLQQSEWLGVWAGGSPLLSASLHTRGCIEAMRQPLTAAVLALQLLSLLVILLQMMIVVLAQLLRTSAQDAVLRGDYDGPGFAAPLGRRPLPPTLLVSLTPHTHTPPTATSAQDAVLRGDYDGPGFAAPLGRRPLPPTLLVSLTPHTHTPPTATSAQDAVLRGDYDGPGFAAPLGRRPLPPTLLQEEEAEAAQLLAEEAAGGARAGAAGRAGGGGADTRLALAPRPPARPRRRSHRYSYLS